MVSCIYFTILPIYLCTLRSEGNKIYYYYYYIIMNIGRSFCASELDGTFCVENCILLHSKEQVIKIKPFQYIFVSICWLKT